MAFIDARLPRYQRLRDEIADLKKTLRQILAATI